ncbi:uncharacterized protein LOC111249339 isoform X2 [Varroa destructor]|uniref:HTH OST-type domain-containing protein n=1 Tax=Varroa destructor TaxID=109461 RepID=A0A7M7K0V4_VARDE|nr:uncharacterized protein LOC111249339 isoform X2 [Varroa destructor]
MIDLDELGAALQSLLDQYTPPVNLHVLLRGYRIHKGMEVPWESYGYSEPATFLRENFPDLLTVHESPVHKGVHLVTLKKEPQRAGRVSNSDGLNGTDDHSGFGAGSASIVSRTSLTSSIPSSCPDALRQIKMTKDHILKKPVPVQFQTYLTRLLKSYPTGISAKAFVEMFYMKSGAPLNYAMYGYPGHLSMFRDLDGVFRVETGTNGEHTLYPVSPFGSLPEGSKLRETVNTPSIESSTNDADPWTPYKYIIKDSQHTNFELVKRDLSADVSYSTNNQEPLTKSFDIKVGRCRQQLNDTQRLRSKPVNAAALQLETTAAVLTAKQSRTKAPQQQPPEKHNSLVFKETTPYGDLFIVELNRNLLVPTACLAALAGMASDQVLEELAECGLDPQDMKFLSGRVPDHKFLRVELARTNCPFIINADGSVADVISLVPIEMCSTVLRALAGSSEAALALVA